MGRRPGKGICCFPLPLWGWHLFSLSLFFLRSPWVLGNTAIHLFFIVSFLFICLLSLAWRAEDEETSPALFTFPCFSNSLYYFILFSYLLSLLLIALLLLARWFSSPSVIFHWYSSLWCILPAVCLNALSRWNTQPLTFLDCSFHSTPYEQKHYSYTPKQFCIGFFSAEQHWPWIPALSDEVSVLSQGCRSGSQIFHLWVRIFMLTSCLQTTCCYFNNHLLFF